MVAFGFIPHREFHMMGFHVYDLSFFSGFYAPGLHGAHRRGIGLLVMGPRWFGARAVKRGGVAKDPAL